ncbi:Ig-like domain-containing protein [Flavobacterium caeni]|uniref:Ig-like domain-containing protein n=1 Tax=Flavobacterium caeni TaxID=490189 RepID=A0A1G5J8I0_9FLAO|nr:hypothetical protein [Flavobacterium caeni]SCY83988.1 hypothetical protein SAMN02927903_02573 [Flavobacterium caeni]
MKKLPLLALLMILLFRVASYGQCNNCQYTITVPNNATHNLTSGQTVCITGTGVFTGRLNNFNGNTLCVGTGVTYNPSQTPNYNGNWTIINHGTFQNTGNLNFNSGTSFTNGATGVITLGNVNVNSNIGFANYGTMTLASLTVNGNGNVTLGGTTTINGSLMNNGNITVIGSVIANGITNNGGGRIIGGPNSDCNYIRSTGSFNNNGIYGQNGTALLVGNTGGSIQSPASSTVPAAPASQASNLQLSGSGNTVSGSFTAATSGGYVILRATGNTVPATTNPANFATLSAGQTLGAWTVVAINSGPGSTTFSDAAPTLCQNIYYRVYTYNATGNCRIYNTTNVLTGSVASTPVLVNTTPASRCGVGSISVSADYSLGSVRWYDASTGGNLVGTGNSLTLNSLSATQTFYASATFGSCTTASRTPVTATINTAPSGSIANSQEVCRAANLNSITINTLNGSVVRWESADDAAFTTNVTPLSNTTGTLSPAQMGSIENIKYFRAVLDNGGCQSTTNSVYVKYPTTTWNGTQWSDGQPDSSKRVIFSGNFSSDEDLYACSVQVNAGAVVKVNSGHNMVVTCGVDVNQSNTPGSLTFEDNASLVQVLDGYTNSGNITYKRNTAPVRRFDYTYWASPVANQNLLAVSPGTLSDKFYQYNPAISNWQGVAAASTAMQQGRGYIIRAPQAFSQDTPAVYAANFVGVPHNGVLTYNVVGTGSGWNLIGNPYPSELDLDDFFAYAGNAALLEGTAYLWTHNTLPSNQVPGDWTYNYTSDDYAVYNSTGSVATRKSLSDGENGNAPSGKVASGQAFFVKAAQSGSVVFNNAMRQRGGNDDFFKQSHPVSGNAAKQRFWLDLTNDQGAFKQILVGYVAGATNGYEGQFDGENFNANSAVNFYSIGGEKMLSIQGRAMPFEVADTVPLGFSSTMGGSFSIAIGKTDAAFADRAIYIKDHLLQTEHNLQTGPYIFTTATGTFNDRFELVFQTDAALGRNEVDSKGLAIWNNQEILGIASPKVMASVQVLDLNGRVLLDQKMSSASGKVDISALSNQMLLLRINFADHTVLTKRFVK